MALRAFKLPSGKQLKATGCSIYALVDPREPKIWRYVGRSFQPRPRRTQHVSDSRKTCGYRTAKEAWIAHLLAEGLEPQIILLETGIHGRQAEAREYAWIERGFALGYPLTNSVRLRRKQPSKYGNALLAAMPWLWDRWRPSPLHRSASLPGYPDQYERGGS